MSNTASPPTKARIATIIMILLGLVGTFVGGWFLLRSMHTQQPKPPSKQWTALVSKLQEAQTKNKVLEQETKLLEVIFTATFGWGIISWLRNPNKFSWIKGFSERFRVVQENYNIKGSSQFLKIH